MRGKRWLNGLAGCVVVVSIIYTGGYHLVTAEWPWQAGGNTPSDVLAEAGTRAEATATTPATINGTLHDSSFDSAVMHASMPFRIYLPPGYDDSAHQNQRYPTVYLLHGAPGSYVDWIRGGKADQTADALIKAGKIPPMILVMPDGMLNLKVDSEWADGTPPAPQAETYLVSEFVPYIDAHYRTIADRDHRAIGGLSTGGYAGVNMTLHHPDVFSTAIGISGGYSTPTTILGQRLFATPAAALYNSPVEYVKHIAHPEATHVYLAVGTADLLDNTQTETKAMEQALQAAHVPHLVQYAAGGHSWDFWGLHLVDGLQFFSATL